MGNGQAWRPVPGSAESIAEEVQRIVNRNANQARAKHQGQKVHLPEQHNTGGEPAQAASQYRNRAQAKGQPRSEHDQQQGDDPE